MKKEFAHEILKAIQHKPGFAKKLKIFAAVAVAGLFIAAGLLVWAGFAMVSYVASQTQQVMESPLAKTQLENLKLDQLNVKAQVPPLPQVDLPGCWQSLQGLMAVQPWLEKPALQNINSLKVACLDAVAPPCSGPECATIKASGANWGS